MHSKRLAAVSTAIILLGASLFLAGCPVGSKVDGETEVEGEADGEAEADGDGEPDADGEPAADGGLTEEDIEVLREQGQEEGWTFEVALNPVTTYPLDQIVGDNESELPAAPEKMFEKDGVIPAKQGQLPASFDWGGHAELPPVRAQGTCGSCWSFATNGVVESLIAIVDGVQRDLAEQYLISTNTLDWGCDGGNRAFLFYDNAETSCGRTGAVMEADFPYSAVEEEADCPYDIAYRLESWGYVANENPSVEQIKQAIKDFGPVYVSVTADTAFQAYSEGIYNRPAETDQTNHGVVLVGWDDDQGTDGVWLLRNSWSGGWGESGYMRIEYGAANVGRWATYAVYADFESPEGEDEGEGECAIDSEAPVITACPDDLGPLDLDSNCEVAIPDLTPGVTATDNCGIPTITQSPAAGTAISVDAHVIFTATDGGGLTDTCQITLTVAPCEGEEGESEGESAEGEPADEGELGIAWSTHLGGQFDEYGLGIAVDSSANIFVTGATYSSGWVSGGWDTGFASEGEEEEGERERDWDGFVVKLTPSGAHVWSSYLGGSENDSGRGIAVDDAGNVFVTGETESSDWVSGGWDITYGYGLGAASDGFVVKLTSSGAHAWSSYLGGPFRDGGKGIAVDGDGSILCTGNTYSSGWVSGGWDTTYQYGAGFVVKLTSSGAHTWSSYFGGSDHDGGTGIAVDTSGNVLVTGYTHSSGWVSGGWDTTFEDGEGEEESGKDGFVAKFSATGAHVWSSYLGGSEEDLGRGIALDGSGNVLITGTTESHDWVSGGWNTTFGGGDGEEEGEREQEGGEEEEERERDGFVVKLSPSGTHAWSSYVGGSGWDEGQCIAVDGSGNVLVAGITRSRGWVSGGWETVQHGAGFVARLTSSGAHIWSSYLTDKVYGITVDAGRNVLATGQIGEYDRATDRWDNDAFVVMIADSGGGGDG